MKTIKPQKLGVLTRCFEWKRQFRMGVSVLFYIPLGERKELLAEVGMWKFVAGELGKDASLDAAMPKATPEFLVHGRAYPPADKRPAPACAVRARLGACEKALLVIGDRAWQDDIPTPPRPFSEMPLDWSGAFGGEGYAPNPLGKGAAAVASVLPLPNVEYPERRITRRGQRADPAGFGPVDQTWPQRMRWIGTYDDQWLKNDFPGFARDVDRRFFNIAPEDQWLNAPLTDDEAYELENLHPDKRVIAGRLPGFQARCCVNRRRDQAPVLEDVSMRLATVWFFPHAERAVLVYQGVLRIAEEDGADIVHLVAAAEYSGQPRPLEHYQKVLEQRLDEKTGHFYALRDRDLLPDGLDIADPDMDADKKRYEGEDLLRKNARKRAVREIEKARAVVAGYGLDPDLHAPRLPPPEAPLPDLDHLPEFMERVQAEAEAQRAQSERELRQREAETEKLFAAMGLDYDAVRRETSERPAGPPAFSAQAQIASMQALADALRGRGLPVAELDGYLADREFRDRLAHGERKLKEVYRLTAHLQDPAPRMAEERSRAVREAIVAARGRQEAFGAVDLTGADLSGLNLQGAGFEGAFLEGVDFSGANLMGCNFQNAVLTRADLTRANLSNARLTGANLGGARCARAIFDGADLHDAILQGAGLAGARFRGACLKGADCSNAEFEMTDWCDVAAAELLFNETDLRGVVLAGASLEQATFLKCDVSGVDFTGARLEGAVFLGVNGQQARFSQARLANVRFVEHCQFSGADFSGADLSGANLRASGLQACRFIRAVLDGADLSESKLGGSSFYMASAREARFVKADLTGAVMASCNLMGAILKRATIINTDFRAANLFQADFGRVRVNRNAKFANALTTRMLTHPRLDA